MYYFEKKYLHGWQYFHKGFTLTVLFLILLPASAQIVERTKIRDRTKQQELVFHFFAPLRYISHQPAARGDIIHIQLRPVLNLDEDNEELLSQLGQRENINWDQDSNLPIKEIIYDGDIPDRPSIIIRLHQTVDFKIRGSSDHRTLRMILPVEPKMEQDSLQPSLDDLATLEMDLSPKLTQVLEEAKQVMLDGDFRRAIQLLTKILSSPKSDVHPLAQELLGVCREKNGQRAHAKAEYENFLERYPEHQARDRVRQRLHGLITASMKPKSTGNVKQRDPSGEISPWENRFYGGISQFYDYDVTHDDEGEKDVNRSELTTDFDWNSSHQTDRYELGTEIVGDTTLDFSDEEDDETRVNTFSLQASDDLLHLEGKLGRQRLNRGGVLGRFDGFHMAYETPWSATLNAVLGYPVASSSQTSVETSKRFAGASIDFGPFFDNWEFNAFFIGQEAHGITDRQAIGGEARYFDPKKSLFTLVDYDLFFNEVNIFILNTSLTLESKTRIHFVYDYRASPLLTSNNAIQGQGVEEVSDLFDTFSDDEIYQLAIDRTSTNESITFGASQELSEHYQVTAEVIVSELTETLASGGVEGIPGTGKEYFYSTQLSGSSLFKEGDIHTLEVRYADTQSNKTTTFILNDRIPFSRKFRLNPRVRLSHRKKNNEEKDVRKLVRPEIRFDYRMKNNLRFEVEVGLEWMDETFFGESMQTTTYFASMGYRYTF